MAVYCIELGTRGKYILMFEHNSFYSLRLLNIIRIVANIYNVILSMMFGALK